MFMNILQLLGFKRGLTTRHTWAFILRMELTSRQQLADKIPSSNVPEIIQAMYKIISNEIANCGGKATAIDIGDILVAISADLNVQNAHHVCIAALKCIERVTPLIKPYLDPRETIGLHVGIAHGVVLISKSEGQLSALGSTVVDATRNLEFAKCKGLSVVISENVFKCVEGRMNFLKHETVTQSSSISIYEIVATDTGYRL